MLQWVGNDKKNETDLYIKLMKDVSGVTAELQGTIIYKQFRYCNDPGNHNVCLASCSKYPRWEFCGCVFVSPLLQSMPVNIWMILLMTTITTLSTSPATCLSTLHKAGEAKDNATLIFGVDEPENNNCLCSADIKPPCRLWRRLKNNKQCNVAVARRQKTDHYRPATSREK